MIAGIFHKGSGIGNQLFRYITTRTLALDKGYEFGMVAPELFKGASFMNLDMGKPTGYLSYVEENTGKVTPIIADSGGKIPPLWEEKTPYYNPEINYVEDNTIIDGNFEDSRYWEHRMSDISYWLKTEPLDVPNDVCVIGFRGGEYQAIPELFLPKEYWDEAVFRMRKINPNMKFEVHTDDPELAAIFFPTYKIIHNVGINWRAMRWAKHAIIANSSFYILPRLMHHYRWEFGIQPITISPKYWNRYNAKKWEFPQNYYKQFLHI